MILDDNFKIIVYRGGTEVFPENSIQAIEDTLREYSNAVIELDLQITKDDEIVAFHDFQLDNLTNGSGLIAQYSIAELQNFNLKNPDKTISQFKVPTLRSIFTFFPNQYFVLDLHENNQTLFQKVIEIVETHLMEDKVAFVSIAKNATKELKKLRPTWTFIASPQETKKFIFASKLGLQKFAETNSQIMFLPNKLGSLNILSPNSISELHKRNIKVWTCNNFKPYQNVNNLTDMQNYKRMNVDGIYTDNPKWLK